ncbi:PD-(D/E)XK nuclease family protein [Opitutus sp. ER46]|uniref:PD-(D/E)XK nuclease family protein n=1 Tax=Opitutus sp. ER46 TaxID=2161864 RepID=UPI000D30145A|nr:PD-(D/E)XK nuclease family protein [Opitutus sp. ER46]PTX91729.1 ATP-dependent nuclease subunit B [Opitutus sp. ER46]
MLKPLRHFLPWDRPLLPQAVAFLAADWRGPEPLDLGRVLVLVPTRQSGRRLREALAERAASRGSAVFPPRVLTPEALVASIGEEEAPSRLESIAAWCEVLRAIDLADFRAVFPVDPPSRAFAWEMRLADQFTRLQDTLGENDLGLADVAQRIAADFPETERWAQLAELERRQADRLRAAGRHPRARGGVARDAEAALAGIERVVLLATVDPLPSALALLESAAATDRAVEVVVYAPSTLAERFDPWGRPVSDVWSEQPLLLPDFEARVHLCADAAEQAARLATWARQYRERAPDRGPEGWLALGFADPEVLPLLEAEATRAGVAVFNPEGRLRQHGALYHLLAALAACRRGAGFEAVEQLVRCPDFLAYVAARGGEAFSGAEFLKGLDDLRRRHLPADLPAARAHAAGVVAAGLEIVADVLARLAQGAFPANVAGVLGDLFGGRKLDSAITADAHLQDAATEWTAVMRASADAARRFRRLRSDEWWELALRQFGESRRAADKPAGALELQGWLELLFEDAPHLVVAGCNDGLVPESVSEDAFLPESLRVRLGLKTNAARFARDAYLLQALVAGRERGGRVDLLLGKVSASGDPLRPSRLLLRCPDAELPQRIAFLFRNPEAAESHRPWQRAWRLQPRRTAPPATVAVTALRRWLVCPYRFYLKYVLRMEAVEAGKSEMDAFDFGTLCHAALEAMGRDPGMRETTDVGRLREFLLDQLTRHARAKFGADLPLPLVIQVESARQRLARFAEVQAAETAAGWVITAVEQPFEVEIAGLRVRGKIDRIDRHCETGAVRVLDYKTSDTAVAPMAAHLRAWRREEVRPDWAVVDLDGKARAWADLQLPLYRHALGPQFGSDIGAGYVNLPKAVSQTGVAVWEDNSPGLQAAAVRCAEGVCAAIRAGEFWPPNEDLRADNDEFAALFHHGVAESVAWVGPAPTGGVT